MSKKLTIALDDKQYNWIIRNGNASHAIRELIDADIKKFFDDKPGTKFPEHGKNYIFSE